MTAENSTAKRTFNITIMRPVFQVAIIQIEAVTREEAIELAQEHELTLKNDEWHGPWGRVIHDETGNELEVFGNGLKPASPRDYG